MRWICAIACVLASGACSDGGQRLVVRTVSERTGKPVPGVRVQVEDQPWATTDGDGKATFDAIEGAFTVRVHESHTDESDQVQVLRNRRGTEVTAEVTNPGPLEWHSARVSGTVGGRSDPGTTLRLGLAPFKDWSISVVVGAPGSFDIDVPWRGGPADSTARAILYAWETDGAEPPGHYYGFGHSAPLDLVDGGVITVVPLPLGPVAEGAIDGALSLPAPATEVSASLWLDFGRYERLELARQVIAPGSFAFVIPSVDGAQAWIRVATSGSAWHHRRVGAPSSTLAFAPPAGPEILEPAADAAIGSATIFRWRAAEPGGSSSLLVACGWTDPVSGRSFIAYRVEADGVEATLPAIPGLAVGSGASCDVVVQWCATADPAEEERCSVAGQGARWE